jgi:hypothetical protein
MSRPTQEQEAIGVIEGSSLRKLGKRLSELLDGDQFANIEGWLFDIDDERTAALVDKDCWLTNAKNLQVGYNELDAKHRVLKAELINMIAAYTRSNAAFERLLKRATSAEAELAELRKQRDDLLALAKMLRPKFGTVGSRDVDVAALQEAVDSVITCREKEKINENQ